MICPGDKNMEKKYTYKKSFAANRHSLVCPNCYEMLSHVDIETFSRCSFCDHFFEECGELEDFILEPIVDEWVSQHGSDRQDVKQLLFDR